MISKILVLDIRNLKIELLISENQFLMSENKTYIKLRSKCSLWCNLCCLVRKCVSNLWMHVKNNKLQGVFITFSKIIFIISFHILNLNNDKNALYTALLYIEKPLNGLVFSSVPICMLILFSHASSSISSMMSNAFFGIRCEYCAILRIRMATKFKH